MLKQIWKKSTLTWVNSMLVEHKHHNCRSEALIDFSYFFVWFVTWIETTVILFWFSFVFYFTFNLTHPNHCKFWYVFNIDTHKESHHRAPVSYILRICCIIVSCLCPVSVSVFMLHSYSHLLLLTMWPTFASYYFSFIDLNHLSDAIRNPRNESQVGCTHQ